MKLELAYEANLDCGTLRSSDFGGSMLGSDEERLTENT